MTRAAAYRRLRTVCGPEVCELTEDATIRHTAERLRTVARALLQISTGAHGRCPQCDGRIKAAHPVYHPPRAGDYDHDELCLVGRLLDDA